MPSDTYRRYVALGDSTTEGLQDPYDDRPGYRGWADRLAERIDAAAPGLLYANLAVRGRKIVQIRDEQLGPALAMRPDLASVYGGINDILRPKVDLDGIAEVMRTMVGALSAGGATVLMLTYVDPAQIIPLARGASARTRAYNAALRTIARDHDARVVDLGRHGVADPRLWHPDRLHANGEGHQRIADAAAHALGLPGADASWRLPLPPAPAASRRAALSGDLRWAGTHLAPWVGRRIRGRSSGDGLTAKRPELALLTDRGDVPAARSATATPRGLRTRP